MGAFARIMEGLAAEPTDSLTTLIDATYLKAFRTVTGLQADKGGVAA